MRLYVIDDLNHKDLLSLKKILDDKFGQPFLDEVYMVKLDESVLNDIQIEHQDCGPYFFALMLGEKTLSAEFLIRSKKTMRCACMGYADNKQALWIINCVNDLLSDAGVSI